ncbi:MAG: ComF family protein [Oceanipulchritudo sp.]
MLKYERGTWLRSEIRALLAGNGWAVWFSGASLVPVPLHRAKLRARGYNQAEVIAAAIAQAFPGCRIRPVLSRVRRTPSQTFLTREQRLRNMKGAFRCTEAGGMGRVILVDDVLTTGATLNAAAAALRRAGVRNISAFTLAHG